MNEQIAELEKQWTTFRNMQMPPAMADLKEELVMLDTYLAGLVSTFLSGGYVNADDVYLNDSNFESRIEHFKPSTEVEENLLRRYKQYKGELDKLQILLRKCLIT